jgi:hypothetical protein
MVTIEKLFDDGEDVLGRNPDVTFLHILIFFTYSFAEVTANIVPKQIATLAPHGTSAA